VTATGVEAGGGRRWRRQGAAEIVQVQSQTLDGQELLFVVFQRQRYEVDAAQQRVTEMDCQVRT
jgi:hypothetical protein